LLRFHERDHRVVALRGELRRMTVVEAANVARELDDRRLHAEADAEERQARLARAANRFDHPFHAAHAEAAGNEESVDVAQALFGVLVAGARTAPHTIYS